MDEERDNQNQHEPADQHDPVEAGPVMLPADQPSFTPQAEPVAPLRDETVEHVVPPTLIDPAGPPLHDPQVPPWSVTPSGEATPSGSWGEAPPWSTSAEGVGPDRFVSYQSHDPGASYPSNEANLGGSPPFASSTPFPATSPGRDRRPETRLLWVAGVIALVGALIGGGVVALFTGNGSSTTATVTTNGSVRPGPALVGDTSIPQLVQKVLPAIVSIQATSPASGGTSINPFGSGGLSINPFGSGGGGGISGGTQDQGTGMIITSNGEVVTNNHVISGATQITVTLYGQTKQLPAHLVGADATDDLALLQIDGVSNLPTVTFGQTNQLQVGDGVVAIGNALGLSAGTPTVTQGIISALGRTVQAGSGSGSGSENLTNLIQTDAAINSGNSGGPLLDSSGDVIGMNTAVASSTAGNAPAQNIGFAITADEITQMIPKLSKGSVASQNAFLGVDVVSMTSQLRQAYGFAPSAGAIISSVQAGSPAQVAGLQQGDVIVGFNSVTINTANDLVNAVGGAKPGQSVQLTVWRGQEKLSITATLASAPAS